MSSLRSFRLDVEGDRRAATFSLLDLAEDRRGRKRWEPFVIRDNDHIVLLCKKTLEEMTEGSPRSAANRVTVKRRNS